jgi:biotin carboxyl carrier protein
MGKTELVAPTAGLVVKINATEGSTVNQGDAIVTLQSMKMEIAIQAEAGGRVTKILVKQGDEVYIGQPIAEIES